MTTPVPFLIFAVLLVIVSLLGLIATLFERHPDEPERLSPRAVARLMSHEHEDDTPWT